MDASVEPGDRARERAAAREALLRLKALPPDDAEYADLREHVIGEYMSYARYLAGKFQLRGESLSDLEQVAYLGLVKAVDNYDPEYGTTFLTYATPMIAGEIKRHFRDTTWDLHVPRSMQELSTLVRAAEAELTQRDGTPPTAADLARHLDRSPDEIAEAYEAAAAHDAASLDVPVAMADGDGATLGELLGDDDPGFDKIVDREALRPLLAELGARDKRILLMRFFRNMSQAQIGAELGVSQMQVSRLLTQILSRLREGVESGH
ncbi:SigB/SigF/SigG family RNA polymerase sigma factor [Catenulispora subtropica]|uniref:RNA polymerase sigma factor SigF n=1 Tax=Catenulispora subtropica TaxID=450798 RepID=A0ABP5DXX2_9ACTN